MTNQSGIVFRMILIIYVASKKIMNETPIINKIAVAQLTYASLVTAIFIIEMMNTEFHSRIVIVNFYEVISLLI